MYEKITSPDLTVVFVAFLRFKWDVEELFQQKKSSQETKTSIPPPKNKGISQVR